MIILKILKMNMDRYKYEYKRENMNNFKIFAFFINI